MPKVDNGSRGDKHDRLLFAIYDDERASAELRAVQLDLADKQDETNINLEKIINLIGDVDQPGQEGKDSRYTVKDSLVEAIQRLTVEMRELRESLTLFIRTAGRKK